MMFVIKRKMGFCLGILLLAMVAGCVAVNPETDQAQDGIPVGYRYAAKLPVGIATIDDARKDLAELLQSRKQPGVKYLGQQDINTYEGRKGLAPLMQGSKGGAVALYDAGNTLLFMAVDGFAVRERSLEVSPRLAFSYTDLLGASIGVTKIITQQPSLGFQILEGSTGMASWVPPYQIEFPGVMSFHFVELPDAQRFADDLYFIQQNLEKGHRERLALFETKAAQYRGMKVKPPVSEEQRRYIVQANALNERKEYAGAIDLYSKAIDIDPVSYPEAYFNLALLSAQVQRFEPAIAYMKQYLLLAPDAKDARSAQDKIYEWELMVRK
ncbi:MAG: tetratricopeptide repeat protein [Desulfurivibrionaceae bacterium]|jgi:tetratricopeptide (TPR) repeat protein